ncbi:alpha-amylase family protein [Salinimicrobium soli]|uniref:alpha-amylase family protein n=2 Tax=Bacteria TaxID=2 RepID=UPI003AAF8624
MDKLWYKNAVIYSLDVESFMDSNGDGIGDLKGLRHRLNYLASLGINCIWLLPFYKTPNRDNGYDIMDYYQIDPRLGDLGHFAELMDAAEEAGIRVLLDLVVNHTSNEHHWFKEARKNKDSKYRDYYIWCDEKPESDGEYAIFGKAQGGSTWKYDDVAGAYYYHTFYEFQPDLNISNPAVQEEIMRIMHFWLKMGISGFRMDAAPHMIREKGNESFEGDPHDVLRRLRAFVEGQKKDAILLAEVDVEPERYEEFFGNGDQMHMLFNFYVNNYIFLALARKSATPIIDALKTLPKFSENEQLANFLRNHDELDLERLTDEERQEVYEAFAPDEDMRIYGRGIRRRLASMLNNDRARLELAYSLLLTLPGSPVLRYGQEIGMGEDLSQEGRKSVRTLMQWSAGSNGGFSKAPKDKLVKKIIVEGPYGYKAHNVNDQHRDPNSFLNWMIRAINLRKESPEYGWGDFQVLETNNSKVLAGYRTSNKGIGIAIHNFSDQEQTVKLELDEPENFTEIFGDKKYNDFDPASQEIKLSPYGYRWFRKRKFMM